MIFRNLRFWLSWSFLVLAVDCWAQELISTPQWFHDAIFYEIFVPAFYDSGKDNVGDLKGLLEKLDYLNSSSSHSLGVSAIWLMPIFQSPSYHGYDVSDYYTVNSKYGTIDDFSLLINAVHERNMHLIIDLPLNHTSDQNPWFKKSFTPGSAYQKWYVWRNFRPNGWKIPWDPYSDSTKVWHQKNGKFYYAVFDPHMPDLNLKNQDVSNEIYKIADFWLDLGVDGFRLDAARYLIETGAGPGQSDTMMTQNWLAKFSRYIKSRKPEAVTVLEAWTANEVISGYFKQNISADSAFNFDLASSILTAVDTGNWKTIKACFTELQGLSDRNYIDSIFLSNHDQNRTASVLNSYRKAKLAASILFLIPGTPFLYYGEEIGTKGVKPDPDIRGPLEWDILNSFINVEDHNLNDLTDQRTDLWNHYKRLITLKKSCNALKNNNIHWISAKPDGCCAFLRGPDQASLLAVLNFSDALIQPDLELPESFQGKSLFNLYDESTVKFTIHNNRFQLDYLKPDSLYLIQAR